MQERGHVQYCISAGSSEVAVGFFSLFVPFLSIICPNYCMHIAILVP